MKPLLVVLAAILVLALVPATAGAHRRHHHYRCWYGIVPVKVAKIGGPWHTIWVRETICGNTVTLG